MELRCDPDNSNHFWPVEVNSKNEEVLKVHDDDEVINDEADLEEYMKDIEEEDEEELLNLPETIKKELPKLDERPGTSMSMSSAYSKRSTTPKLRDLESESVTPTEHLKKYKYLAPGKLNFDRPVTPLYENASVKKALLRRNPALNVRSKTPTAAQMSSRSRSNPVISTPGSKSFQSRSGSKTPNNCSSLPYLNSNMAFGYKKPDPTSAYNMTSRQFKHSQAVPKLSTFYNTMLSNKIYL